MCRRSQLAMCPLGFSVRKFGLFFVQRLFFVLRIAALCFANFGLAVGCAFFVALNDACVSLEKSPQ